MHAVLTNTTKQGQQVAGKELIKYPKGLHEELVAVDHR